MVTARLPRRATGALPWMVLALTLFAPADTAGQPAPSCTISTTSVSFGIYDVFATAPLDSTGSVRYNCNSRTRDILVTLGPGASGTFSLRTLQKVGENLGYNLYIDSARTQVWGDGSGGSQAHANANPPNTTLTLTIYGRIPAGQDVSPGLYSDNVVAEINF